MTEKQKCPIIASLSTGNSLSTQHCCPSIYPASQESLWD